MLYISAYKALLCSFIKNVIIFQLIKHCWEEKPSARPTFTDIKKQLHNINPNKVNMLFFNYLFLSLPILTLLVRIKSVSNQNVQP